MQIALVGRIQTRTYDDTEGKKHYVTEVVAEEVYFADSKKEQQEPQSDMQFENNLNQTADLMSDDLPF